MKSKMRKAKNKSLKYRRLRGVVLRMRGNTLSLRKMNIEDVTIGELLKLQELTILDLSGPEQVKSRGELLAKIFGPDTELEAIINKYYALDAMYTKKCLDNFNLRQELTRAYEQVRKLAAHVEKLKQQIQDA